MLIFAFISFGLGGRYAKNKILLLFMSKSIQPIMFSGLTFRTLIEFIFVYVVRKFSNPSPL